MMEWRNIFLINTLNITVCTAHQRVPILTLHTYIAQCSVCLALGPQHAKHDSHHSAFHFSPDRTRHSSWGYSVTGMYASRYPISLTPSYIYIQLPFVTCSLHLFVEMFLMLSFSSVLLFILSDSVFPPVPNHCAQGSS